MRTAIALLLASVAVTITALDPPDAAACAIAPPPGAEVRTAEEEALIIWDPATRTEHFIRRAAFESTTAAFGFLVPTPAVPQLGEVPDDIFETLGRQIRPGVEYVTEGYELEVGALACSMAGGLKKSADTSEAMPPGVRVLQTASVAGFDATTVAADDAGALSAWLGAHGFASTPALTAWLERYVADRWTITAFVVASPAAVDAGDEIALATRAVRMTFTTDRPFYPYREPERAASASAAASAASAASAAARLLRVWFLSDARYAATLAGAPWSADVLYAGHLSYLPDEVEALPGATLRATVFHDESSPRRAVDELYFATAADQSPVQQPPTIVVTPRKIFIPLDVIALGVLVVYLLVRRRFRR